MARRRNKREKPHGLDWHEAMLAEPWNNYSTTGDNPRPLTPREYDKGMEGKRQQMEAHDSQPKRMRELVAEHNVNKGIKAYSDEMRARPKSERCMHGRFAESCAQCVYQRSLEARKPVVARDGTVVERKDAGSAAEILARRGTWAR